MLRWDDPLRMSTHRNAPARPLRLRLPRHGWEGIIAKRADAPYRQGRSPDWLKMKCAAGQEFVIGGFTEPKGSRAAWALSWSATTKRTDFAMRARSARDSARPC